MFVSKPIGDIIIAIVIVSVVIILAGCDVEDSECAREDMYISGYQEITYPSGDTYIEPILVCP